MLQSRIVYTIECRVSESVGEGVRRSTTATRGNLVLASLYSEETPEAKGAHWRAVLECLALEALPPNVPQPGRTTAWALAEDRLLGLTKERDAALREVEGHRATIDLLEEELRDVKVDPASRRK